MTKMQGFEAEFVSSLDEKYTCPVCNKALKEPLQTSCGHRFCEGCLNPLISQTDPRCPLDEEPLISTEVFRDVCCKREILCLVCYCIYKKYGCDWCKELRLLEEHIAVCPYQEVPCSNTGCTVKLSKIAIDEHLKNECHYKKEPCPYCEEPISLAEHEVCPRFPLACPSRCGTTDIPRELLKEHLTNQCALAEVLCSYHIVGCTFKGLREEVKDHKDKCEDFHLLMVSRKLTENNSRTTEVGRTVEKLVEEKASLETQLATQNETVATTVQNMRATQARLSNVEKMVSDQRKDLAQVRRNLETSGTENESREHFAAQFEEFSAVLERHEAKMVTIERDLARAAATSPSFGPRSFGAGANLMSFERRLDRNEHQLTLQDIQLSEQDLKIKLLEATSHDGTYIWKIDEWPRRLQEGVSNKTPSIYSPPFYVGRFGYKLCARVYPNGDGMGKGSHFSLFFVVMRGEYDALLPWPFSQKVTFRLMDQNGDQDVVDSFRPDPNSSSFRKPTSNMNIASGCPLFISHSALQTRGYVKDGIIFIRIDIDKAGLPPICI